MKIQNLTIYQGAQLLIENANIFIPKNYKVGLVGQNGCGKTTLLETILGKIEPQSGEISIPPGLTIAHIEQNIPSLSESAVHYIMRAQPQCHQLFNQIIEAEEQQNLEQLASLHAQLAEADGYFFKAQAEKTLIGLGFTQEQLNQTIESFSGGWRMRLHLARCLLVKSDFLLLDEPTNHLDLNGILWLQSWLLQFKGTLILISHDRDFLDQISDHILHLERKKLQLYTGNYTSFIDQRTQALNLQAAQFKKQQQHIKHMMSYVERFRYKASKSKQAQSRLKAIERLEKVDPIVTDSSFTFSFQQPEPLANPLINLDQASISIDHKVLLHKINLSIETHSRIGLLGKNGAGKSTFLKALTGKLAITSGELVKNNKLKIGYFSQHQIEIFKPEDTALGIMLNTPPLTKESQLRNYLGMFGFSGDKVFQATQDLSGGEKARLALAKIIWQRPHLLLLDEPTNHLDLTMREALNVALQQYNGAILLVSHDRFLMRSIADELWLVDQGTVKPYHGDLEDYTQLISQNLAQTQVPTKKLTAETKRKIKDIEKEIDKLTKRINLLDQEMLQLSQSQEFQSKIVELNQEKQKMQKQLNDLEETWLHFQLDES